MKKFIALVLCCTIICVSGETAETSNNKIRNFISTTAETVSTNSTTQPSKFPSTSSKTSTNITVANNTIRSITEVPKSTGKIISASVLDSKPYKWVLNGTNSSIIIQMSARLTVAYYNSTSKQNATMEIDVPANNDTQVDGNFTQYHETLRLSWKSIENEKNYVLFHFMRFMNTYVLNNLEVSINPKDIPDGSNSTFKLVHTQEHFNTSVGNSYRCIRLQTFNLTRENSSAVVGCLQVSDLQFQAFKTDKKTTFSLAEDCAFDTPDVVPIAVGCVLAGLVIIVLAAYLISRRRSDARGYHSM